MVSNIVNDGVGISPALQIYKTLRIPDFGWRLVKRNAFQSDTGSADYCTTNPSGNKSKVIHKQHSGLRELQNAVTTMGGTGGVGVGLGSLTKGKVEPQMLQRGLTNGGMVLADVPSIGMNIAEQLYRLERRHDNRHFLPTDMLGWKIAGPEYIDGFRIVVINNRTPERLQTSVYFGLCWIGGDCLNPHPF